MKFYFRRGETITILLDADDKSSVSTVSALIKVSKNGTMPPATDVSVGAFTISSTITGWSLTYPSLPADTYVTDAKLTLTTGAVIKTDPLYIEVDESCS